MKIFFIVCVLLSLVLADLLIAATHYVSPGDGITQTIDKANSGDTVILRDGRYFQRVHINKSITLKAGNPNQAAIDGGVNQSLSWWKSEDCWVANVPFIPRHIVLGPLSVIQMSDNLKNYGNGYFQGGFYYDDGKVFIRTANRFPDIQPDKEMVSLARGGASGEVGIYVNADAVTIDGLVIRCFVKKGIELKDWAHNVTVRNCNIYGCYECVFQTPGKGRNITIEHNEIGNYPIYTVSCKGENVLWDHIYDNEEEGGWFGANTTAMRLSPLDSKIRFNIIYEQMDGIRPHSMYTDADNDLLEISHNLLTHCRDDAVEFDARYPQSIRFHHNILVNNYIHLGPSPVQEGVVTIDHNLIISTGDNYDCTYRSCFMKYECSWAAGYIRRLRIIHNTFFSRNNNTHYTQTQPSNPSESRNDVWANNILAYERDGTSIPGWYDVITGSISRKQHDVGFQSISQPVDLRLTSGSVARDQGSNDYDWYHASDGPPDAGAIEYGDNFSLDNIGPNWAGFNNVPSRPAMSPYVSYDLLGLRSTGSANSPNSAITQVGIGAPANFENGTPHADPGVLIARQHAMHAVQVFNSRGRLLFETSDFSFHNVSHRLRTKYGMGTYILRHAGPSNRRFHVTTVIMN